MPYQAQMLDLRLKNDPEKNGDIPRELAAEWIEMYRANLPGMLERSQDKPFRMRRVLENTYQEYLRLLEGIMKSEHFTLRELLGTEFNSNIPHSMERGNPFWASLFSTFMVKQGYDGVIQIEQSERQKDKYPPTYVFYNLEKIGDYDTWHAEEAANP